MSISIFTRVVISSLLVMLAACANPSIEQLKAENADGSPFQNSLAQHYLQYAKVKESNKQDDKATLFADKGITAATGGEVEPEMVENWNIAEASRGEFQAARQQIISLVNDQTKENKPEAAAGAIFSYDCWLDQSELNAASTEALYCRAQMQNAMQELSSATNDMALEEDQQPMDANATNRYVVYFALNEFILDDAAKATLSNAYQQLGAMGKITIAVNGHTDTSGNDRYNMMLSNQRANAVKEMLEALGLKGAEINTYGFGETDLAVPTPDDTIESKNRRVEIVKQ